MSEHVVVTGASSGIGEAIAREFGRAGARLTLVARRRELLDKLAADLGERARVVTADLADPAQVVAWLDDAVAAFGPVDVLVNNAGMQIVGPAHATDPARGEALLRLNLHTPLRLTIAVLPSMIERHRGTIVDVASMAGLAPTPGMIYYNASKGGLAAASEALRGELRTTGVHVVTVYPGPVHTDMGAAGISHYEDAGSTKRMPWGTAPELAVLIRRAVLGKKARVIYPRTYALARHFPALTRWLMDRMTPPLKQLPPKA